MTKKAHYELEEKYEMFELFESKEFYAFRVSDKLFEKFNKMNCIVEAMREFLYTKSLNNANRRLNAT